MHPKLSIAPMRTLHIQQQWIRPRLTAPTLLQVRFATSGPVPRDANSVIQNAAEEMKNMSSDLAKTIAGNRIDTTSKDPSVVKREAVSGKARVVQDFVGITTAIASEVPKHILYAGLAGTLPYLGTTFSTLYCARTAGLVPDQVTIALLESSTHIQVTYGAVILSFLGALHWGMEFAGYGGYMGYKRLVFGVTPLLAAWPTLAMEPHTALVVQWFTFTTLWYADMKATEVGWAPRWYSQYRFYLSILVGSCIIATLLGINYFGPTTQDIIEHNLPDLGGVGSAVALINRDTVSKRRAYEIQEFTIGPDVPVTVEDGTASDADAYLIVKAGEKEEILTGDNEESGAPEENTQNQQESE
ncbi:uncharacterized protein EI90DRAFT_3116116 [Cantharellus anzutake]|uniref:uncharacterized protein n=1 Tax=Cantharellus anzutake TaxID=1750568 RepID=UPI001904827D|nr:uncharacterized protein EI90DRAFT_3116116 [Cantharellus anzutake]KAF8342177.1 hypothetical protein EI90DRAFT_3116116 [Cantharellus anzutake]